MKYSIITINFNNREGLCKTIESVVSQSFKDYEYIIIDGGSTDGSVDVIKQYADKIDYWVSEPDKGIYNAMNKGILKAHGEYLNFMNSGDYFFDNNVLEKVNPFLKADIIQGLIYDNAKKDFSKIYFDKLSMRYFYEGTIWHQAGFFNKSLFKDSLYNENYKIVSDWLFYMQKIIFENKKIDIIPICVAFFEGDGISSNNTKLNSEERKKALQSLLPQLILCDYEYYKGKDSPILNLIPQFNKTYGLHKFIYHTIKFILYIHKLIFK